MTDWEVTILSLSEPDVICRQSYSNHDLLNLLTGNATSDDVSSVEDIGLRPRIEIDKIEDNTKFATAFLEKYFEEDEIRVRKVEPRDSHHYSSGNNFDKGHPDFLVDFMPEWECVSCGKKFSFDFDGVPNACPRCGKNFRPISDASESDDIEVEGRDTIAIELKKNGDPLRSSQLHWLADNIGSGMAVWLLLVENKQ